MNATHQRWYSPGNLLSIFQILAILGAAGSGIYLFFRFEEKQKELSLSLLKAQNQQAAIVLNKEGSVRLSFSQDLEVADLGAVDDLNAVNTSDEHTFLVWYNYSITNIGSKSFEVTYLVVDTFIAEAVIPDGARALGIGSFDQEGGVNWIPLLSRGFYYRPKWKDGYSYPSVLGKMPYEGGGGGTAVLDAGESSKGFTQMLIRARPSDLVGFMTKVGLNGGDVPEKVWDLLKVTSFLSDADEPK